MSPAAARALIGLFVATILVVPLVQHFTDLLGGPGRPAAMPQVYQVVRLLPSPAELAAVRDLASLRGLLPAAGEIRDFEQALEQRSVLRAATLPYAQLALTAWLRTGNEQAYLGAAGWLYYRPSVDYVTGPGFLGPRRAARVLASVPPPPGPDPVQGILDVNAQLARRGARLFVLPVPDKPILEPEPLAGGELDVPLQNPSFAAWRAALERAGVPVLDPAPILARARADTREPQYLRGDSHWTPAAVKETARVLAALVRDRVELPATGAARFSRVPGEVAGVGDLVAMLRLPDPEAVFAPQRVVVERVTTADGEPWRPAADADVLLLGDSFSNIYSLAAMGWGEGGGLAEQLSVELGRPLDRIVRNDGGSLGTRLEIAAERARGVDRLAGKRVVIWQFAMRELAFGDWRHVDLGHPVAGGGGEASGEGAGLAGAIVRATVAAYAGLPEPGSVPYADCLTALRLTDIQATGGAAMPGEGIAYVLVMRDHRLTAAAGIRPGDRVTLRLVGWQDGEPAYGSLNRLELDDERLAELPAWWAELVPGTAIAP